MDIIMLYYDIIEREQKFPGNTAKTFFITPPYYTDPPPGIGFLLS